MGNTVVFPIMFSHFVILMGPGDAGKSVLMGVARQDLCGTISRVVVMKQRYDTIGVGPNNAYVQQGVDSARGGL